MLRLVIALTVTACCVPDSQAGPFRRRVQSQQTYQHNYQYQAQSSFQHTQATPGGFSQVSSSQSMSVSSSEDGGDALDEVNAARAARGLRPFMRDPALTQGALAAARTRAARFIQGHLPNDFSMLPPGAQATSAGCAAWPQGMGWGACCTYESHTYAGAAWAIGADGRRYMHIFVR